MWVEFIATGDLVVDRTETITNWKRHSSAMARLNVARSLITPIAHRDLVDLGPAPEPRRRGQRYERQWHERLQTNWPDASHTAPVAAAGEPLHWLIVESNKSSDQGIGTAGIGVSWGQPGSAECEHRLS